jgi:hypothetical protein
MGAPAGGVSPEGAVGFADPGVEEGDAPDFGMSAEFIF